MTRIEKLEKFPYRLILGSASPRRQQLLRDMGFIFAVEVISADESDWPAHLKAHEIPLFLAEKKSHSFSRVLKGDELLVTSDTVVWREGRVYNKPSGYAEGKAMLRSLSNGMHEVFTAVCLRSGDRQKVFYGATKVYFKALPDEEIDHYLRHFKPYDKAGSYGVQDWLGLTGIEKIEGSFYNVMGLPVQQLYEELLTF
jgi:septum formation protein